MSLTRALSPALPRRLAGLAVAALLAVGITVSPIGAHRAEALTTVAQLNTVARTAAAQVGVRYRYGGTTPRTGFDCSGLTKYAYAKAHKYLPRTAQQQYNYARHISRASARPGDLVFFHSSRSRVYHVAVYAGHGYIWHAPKPGKRVAKVKIWTSAVSYGRTR